MSNTSLTTKVTQSRGWTLALGIAAAALAAILLIAYLVQYRSSVNDSTAPTPVLVAKSLIPKGTSGHRDRREAALPGRDACRRTTSRSARSPTRRTSTGASPWRTSSRVSRSRRRTSARVSPTPSRRSSPGSSARWRSPSAQARASSATSRAATASTSTTRPAPTTGRSSACSRRTFSSCGLRGGRPMIIRADAPLAQKLALASNTGTLWFFARPAGNAKPAPKRSITSTDILQQISRQPRVR